MTEIPIGVSHTSTEIVTEVLTAQAMGSGGIDVFATPAMVALMERAARKAIRPFLTAEESSVGTMINIVHTRATPVGNAVTATATVSGVDGRRVDFEVVAHDQTANVEIGRGSHIRFVVETTKFMTKIQK